MFQKFDFGPSNSFVIAIIASLLMTIMGGAVAMWYLGTFAQTEVKREISEPRHMAYIYNVGPYDKISAAFEKVANRLRQAGIEPEAAFALLMDGSNVHASERRSKIGYLISGDGYVPAPLETGTLPEREVLIAAIKGGTVGSYSGYRAMKAWAEKNGYRLLLPALEIYHPDGVVEYQLGISRATDE